MRFQQGVDDNPTRLPISATASEASSCSTANILRSMASMKKSFNRHRLGLSIEKNIPNQVKFSAGLAGFGRQRKRRPPLVLGRLASEPVPTAWTPPKRPRLPPA